MEHYLYDYEKDSFYCYPNSNVLINKLDITDSYTLQMAEREITSLRMAEILQTPIYGIFNFQHLKMIHKAIFQDIFEWAGDTRSINITKGNQFCRCEFIEQQALDLFDKLKNEKYLNHLSRKDVVTRLAFFLAEINAIHPFREGNGRAQRVFIEYLALHNRYRLDFSGIKSSEMIEASALSFLCQYEKMECLVDKIIYPFTGEDKLYYQNYFI